MDELENSTGSEYESDDDDVEENNGQEYFDTSSDEQFDQDGRNQQEERGNQQDEIGNENEEIGNETTSTKKKARGVTRLVKLHKDFNESKGQKRVVEFDELGRLTGKYRAEFSSFLGDLVRHDVGLRFLKWKEVTKELKDKLWDSIRVYYEIDESRRKQMMCHLAKHLRDFRRKLYAKYIQPNIGKPRKLKVVPKPYDGFMEQKDWVEFVEWRLSPEFKDVSKAAKEARAKAKYPHRLGRAGYSGLREKLIKNKELAEDEVPTRSFMWVKAREMKDGEYKDDDVRNVANEITCHEKEIAEGSVNPDQGTDALTLVFGKDHNGRVRGVGKGVTPTKYWHIPRRKGTSNERIAQLEKQLDDERKLREAKDEEVKHLSAKMQEQEQTLASRNEEVKDLSATVKEQGQQLNAVLSHLASQGMESPQFPNTRSKSEKQEYLRSSRHSSRSRQEPSNAISSSHNNVQESENMASDVVPTKVPIIAKCRLAHPDPRNVVARGTIYFSSEKQTIHGVTLNNDCYRVSIDELIKPAAFLPIQAGEHKTVGDAINSFVAWPKSLVIPDSKELEPTSHQDDKKQNPKKRKKNFTTVNELQKPKHTRSSFNKHKSNILDI